VVDVDEALRRIPRFSRFVSVGELAELAESLRDDPRFEVRIAGTSVNGVPIHHVRFGGGSVKALVVGGVHSMEPIGGLTVFSVLSLLRQGSSALLAADVEWHIVPCIDPDGALLNEGWTLKSFSLESFMKSYFMQAYQEQVDMSFPISYKRLIWDRPSREALILKRLLDEIRPDFYYPAHTTRTGGAFFYLAHDAGPSCHQKLYALLKSQGFPLQTRPLWRELYTPFAPGILPMHSIRILYDYLEKTTESPEAGLPWGMGSFEYLSQIKPDAQVFIAEMGLARHPQDQSTRETGQNLRHFKLRMEADSKFLCSVLLQEWEKVKDDVDASSPFYRAIVGGTVLLAKEKLAEGGFPLSRYPTRDTLFNPDYDRVMTEGDRYDACFTDGGYMFLHMAHQLVRLLKSSAQTPAIAGAIERLEPMFDRALAEIGRHVDLQAFEVFDHDILARVHLGSGLVVLESVLEARRRND
jgi:hypothetical protein